jgi:hypothetical protein
MRQLPPLGIFAIARDINEGGVPAAAKGAMKTGVSAVRTVGEFGLNVLQTAHYAGQMGMLGQTYPGQTPMRSMRRVPQPAWQAVQAARLARQANPQPPPVETSEQAREHGH